MIFKLLWNILKNVKWLISIAVLIIVTYLLFSQYKAIKASPIGAFLPNTPLDSFDTSKLKWPNFSNAKPTGSITPTTLPSTIKFKINTSKGDVVYTSETALTPDARALGLMFRTSLPAYNGMFFVFDYPIQYGFWMKNCEFPQDMIFFNDNYEIVDILKDVPPCKTIDPTQEKCPSYIPKAAYRYVLEINAGSATTNNLEIGQKGEIQ